jgi:hypothetical protein
MVNLESPRVADGFERFYHDLNRFGSALAGVLYIASQDRVDLGGPERLLHPAVLEFELSRLAPIDTQLSFF